MTHHQPQLPLASRIIAAGGCVAIWLAGVSACNLGALFCCDSHGSEAMAHADPEHSHDAKDADAGAHHANDADAHHSDDADHRSPDSHQHGGKECSCCSTLIAVGQTAKPVAVSKPDFHSISLLCALVETRAASLAVSENPSNRHAESCDRVFAPEVCLGPAHRSHAPPAFRLI